MDAELATLLERSDWLRDLALELVGDEHAAEAVRKTWRELEELNLSPQLAFEALFIRISREL
jgi:hypothetical protein